MTEKKFNVVGKRLEKIEARQKITGELKFSGDITFPGSLHAKILRSPCAHAHIKHIDTSKALKLKGVKAVITHEDVPEIPTMHQFLHLPSVMFYDSFLLEKKVRHYGDRVAAVAATSPEIAEEALELIKVEYEPLQAVFDPMEAIKPNAPVIHDAARRGETPIQIKNNIVATREIEIGDVEKGFLEADFVLENVFKTSRPNNAPLERTVVVCVPEAGGKLEIYGTTQGIHAMRMNLAAPIAQGQLSSDLSRRFIWRTHPYRLDRTDLCLLSPPDGKTGSGGKEQGGDVCHVWSTPDDHDLANRG
jgi:CO/xanthine dehydrogenase Mo-binding subunit